MHLRNYLIAAALAAAVAAGALSPLPARADEPAWTELSALVFDDRPLLDGSKLIAIDSPYRTEDDARTHIAAQIAAPAGRMLGKVTLVLDENPMPVSAVFDFERPQPRFFFDVTFRINGPTPVHVVAETTDGQLYVAEAFVKTSGKGACAAPPGTDPELAMATLGDMALSLIPPASSASPLQRLSALGHADLELDVDISHPSHSGMQMDQISLLFIPMRYVERLDIELDGGGFMAVTGSISLAENPALRLSVPGDTQRAGVTLTDTDGTVTHAETALPGY